MGDGAVTTNDDFRNLAALCLASFSLALSRGMY
jgi:hypothetical protein